MEKRSSSSLGLLLMLVLAGAAAYGIAVLNGANVPFVGANAQKPAVVPPKAVWAAAAAGRIEPRGGEIRLVPQVAGRIVEVAVKVNDVVKAGDLLVRLEDDEIVARIAALEIEAAVRRRERDLDAAKGVALERRQAEDAVADAERAIPSARARLDEALRVARIGGGNAAAVDVAKAALKAAREKLDLERQGLRRALAASGLPLPNRLEAVLAAGRSELLLAEIAHERTRLRAPVDGTVLQVLAREGETAAPGAEGVLVVLGDMSVLRVRAEVEERDAPKIRLGQRVVVRADAYPGQDFDGTVTSLAKALGAPKLAQRGPRRPTDVDVLEVMVDLAASDPRPFPGMRVDVFFRPDPSPAAPAPKAN